MEVPCKIQILFQMSFSFRKLRHLFAPQFKEPECSGCHFAWPDKEVWLGRQWQSPFPLILPACTESLDISKQMALIVSREQ